MDKLLGFVLACYAAWFVFSQSDLPGWGRLRDWLGARFTTFHKLVNCPLCSGFWCSLLVAVMVQWPVPLNASGIMGVLLAGLTGAAAVFLIETHVMRLERE